MFNVQDKNLTKGEYATCSVMVTPKSGATKLSIESHYQHTYNKTNWSWELGGNFEYVEKSAGGGFTFQLKGNMSSYTWPLAADNDVYL